MIPASFDYVRATSLSHAIGLLQNDPDGTKLVAGGHTLIPTLKLRLATPALLIDRFTPERVDAFHRDGFLILEEGLVSERALTLLRERYERLYGRDRLAVGSGAHGISA